MFAGIRCLSRLALISFAAGLAIHAQTAQLTGRVTDRSGLVVPETKVTATNEATRISRATATNVEGYYTLPLLNPGSYELVLEKTGFRALKKSGIRLEVAQVGRLDFSLQVGDVAETITVSEVLPILTTESATIRQVIGSKKIVDLPLNGRDFTQLATLVPGAVTAGTSGNVNSPNIIVNGSRRSKTVFMLDGLSVTNQNFDGANIVPSVDAIQEFAVQSNAFAAEYGQGTAVINISLKSGTNTYHGSIFEFLRNEALDARNFFNLTGVTPRIRQHQYGVTLGGPLTIPRLYRGKDRTFYFVSYQASRNRRPSTTNVAAPTEAMRGGDFSQRRVIVDPATTRPDPNRPGSFLRDPFPGSRIPSNRIAPQALYFLPFFPLPNTAAGTYTQAPARIADSDRLDVRFDHQIRSSDSLQMGYSLLEFSNYNPGPFPKNGTSTLDVRSQRANLGYIHMFTPTMINELRLGYLRSESLTGSPEIGGTNHTVQSGIGGFEVQSRAHPGFPGIQPTGYQGLTNLAFSPLPYRDNKYDVSDSLTWIRGRHNFKAGANLRRYSTATINGAHSRGLFTFTGTYTQDGWSDFLLGLPFNGQRSFPRNLFGIRDLKNEHFFVQDDWKVSPRLTLNVGMRYELNHPHIRVNDQMISTDLGLRKIVIPDGAFKRNPKGGQQVSDFLYPLFQDVIVSASQAGIPQALRHLDKNNFAPRLGMAWRPGSGDFVIRAGYGFFYGLVQGNRLESTMGGVPFQADELSNFNTTPAPSRTLSNMFEPLSAGLNLTPTNFFQADPYQRDPYFQQWNLTLQKVVAQVVSLEGAYVASKGTKVEFSRPINIPRPGPGVIQDRREWTRFATGTFVENSGNTNYHAFQGKVELRSWRGLSWLGSYAFAKSIDNLSDDVQTSSAQDPNDLRAERGLSSFDVKHRFVVSGNYELPFGRKLRGVAAIPAKGWEIGSIVTLQTGTPFTTSIATDVANTGRSMRPDHVGSGKLSERTLARDFDVQAFRVPAQFTYGNSPRNVLYRRGFKNWDFVALKNQNVADRFQVQFRAEFFNFTNTPAFGAPVSNIQAANAGQILSAGEPRSIQLALKVVF
ncbi:MAG: TonB-dependent receptor [Bryobacterales bacterium]|nr:TonB-dependent receptor [Bryobacterales bacterium]